MKIRLIVFTVFLILIFKHSFAQTKLFSASNNMEAISDSTLWINMFTVVNGNAFSGNYYSSTDSLKQFGLGYKSNFPVPCQNKNLHIFFSEYIRADKIGSDFFMVVTIVLKDSVIVWDSKKISARIKNINTWTEVKDEIELPSNVTGDDYILSIYLWNKTGNARVDMDDFKIDFEEKIMPSFIPAGFIQKIIPDGWEKIMTNESYAFFYNKQAGQIMLLNKRGDTIINSLTMFSEWTLQNKKERKQSWNYRFDLEKDSVSQEGNYIILSAQDDISKSEISILAGINGNLTFNLKTEMLRSITLYRNSLLTGFSLPLKEVYKKSTLIDSINFKNEYWLDKEGYLLSNGRSSLFLYRPEKISSLQIDVKKNVGIFNLDYCADHPLLHYPILKNNENKYEDYSASVYSKGNIIKSLFTIYSVNPEFKSVRVLSNQYGYLSSFIWTEHADYTDLRTHKAVYLGSEKINSVKDATGGFLKYSIPVTKSIFYANPDQVNNLDKAGFMPGPVANYKETPGFRDFLRLLDESGIEICLHTPDHFTTTRKLLSEALDKTKNDFFPVTWIDHGYDNSKSSNREDIVCDGADSTSKWYAADLWKKYGIKYFWNSFNEDSGIYKSYAFNSFFSVPYSGWDESMPTPLYWKNKTRTGDIIHWRTAGTLDPENGNLWSYYFNDLRLTDLVNNRNNIIVHCYPARVDSTNGFYVIKDGLVEANEEFNHALSKLSSYRSQEKIRLTTIRDMLDYRTSIENITYEIMPEGIIRIHNSGNMIIHGLSFSTSATNVNAGAKEIEKKIVGNELIFWFDIAPGENVLMVLN